MNISISASERAAFDSIVSEQYAIDLQLAFDLAFTVRPIEDLGAVFRRLALLDRLLAGECTLDEEDIDDFRLMLREHFDGDSELLCEISAGLAPGFEVTHVSDRMELTGRLALRTGGPLGVPV